MTESVPWHAEVEYHGISRSTAQAGGRVSRVTAERSLGELRDLIAYWAPGSVLGGVFIDSKVFMDLINFVILFLCFLFMITADIEDLHIFAARFEPNGFSESVPSHAEVE